MTFHHDAWIFALWIDGTCAIVRPDIGSDRRKLLIISKGTQSKYCSYFSISATMRLQGGGDSWEALNTNEEAARLEAKKLAMHMLSIDDDFSNIEGRLQTAREDMSSESTDASQIDGLLAEWVEYKKVRRTGFLLHVTDSNDMRS